jgi:hypothetical protein
MFETTRAALRSLFATTRYHPDAEEREAGRFRHLGPNIGDFFMRATSGDRRRNLMFSHVTNRTDPVGFWDRSSFSLSAVPPI